MKITLLFAVTACAQITWGQIGAPQIGVMLTSGGAARPLQGIAGSLTIGDAAASGVISMGCSANICLMKTALRIVSSTGTVDAPAGPAMFWFVSDSALVYFSQTKQLMRWHSDVLAPIVSNVTGEVLSIRQTAEGSIQFATRVRGAVWMVDRNGALLESISGAAGAVLLLDNGVLFATRDGLVLRRDDATEIRFPIGLAESLSWLGGNYVQARTGSSNWAVRVDAGHERGFLLPEPQ